MIGAGSASWLLERSLHLGRAAIGSLSARLPPAPVLATRPGADALLQQLPLPRKSAQTLDMTATHSLTRRQTLNMSTTNLLSEPSVLRDATDFKLIRVITVGVASDLCPDNGPRSLERL